MTARKCALEECNNLIYKNARYKWNKYCCIEHGRISCGRILSNYRQRIDLDRVKQLAAQGRYASDIAEEFNVAPYDVWRFALKHSVALKYTPRHHTPTCVHDVSEFWQQHSAELVAAYEAGETLTAIAKKLGITVGAVAGRLTRLDRIGERKFPITPSEPMKPSLPGGCMWPVVDGWCSDEIKRGHSYCEKHATRAHRPTAPMNVGAIVF